jgi:hypothetical protein
MKYEKKIIYEEEYIGMKFGTGIFANEMRQRKNGKIIDLPSGS